MIADTILNTRIAPIYRVSAALFVLLFTVYFPVMTWLGLRSPIFWVVFAVLWACAALHGRLTREQSTDIRRGIRPFIWMCFGGMVWLLVKSIITTIWLGLTVDLDWMGALFLANFCAITALVSSYKQNPS